MEPHEADPGSTGDTDAAELSGLFMTRPEGVPSPDGAFLDLVGWATRHIPRAERELMPRRARDLLAAALAVPVDSLTHLDDNEVRTAVDRIRGLVDQCRMLAAEVSVDELTGALRRGAGMIALQREIDRARRSPGRGTVVAFIDADGLKRVNDTQGHAAGDEFLRAVVAALRERLRSYDLIVRYGGDEFFCVLGNAEVAFAQRLMTDIQESVSARTGGLSVSVGVTAVESTDNAESVVARADQKLYATRRGVVRR